MKAAEKARHSRGSVYKCLRCNKYQGDKYQVEQHLMLHHRLEVPYKCTFDKKFFGRRKPALKHLDEKHKGVKFQDCFCGSLEDFKMLPEDAAKLGEEATLAFYAERVKEKGGKENQLLKGPPATKSRPNPSPEQDAHSSPDSCARTSGPTVRHVKPRQESEMVALLKRALKDPAKVGLLKDLLGEPTKASVERQEEDDSPKTPVKEASPSVDVMDDLVISPDTPPKPVTPGKGWLSSRSPSPNPSPAKSGSPEAPLLDDVAQMEQDFPERPLSSPQPPEDSAAKDAAEPQEVTSRSEGARQHSFEEGTVTALQKDLSCLTAMVGTLVTCVQKAMSAIEDSATRMEAAASHMERACTMLTTLPPVPPRRPLFPTSQTEKQRKRSPSRSPDRGHTQAMKQIRRTYQQRMAPYDRR